MIVPIAATKLPQINAVITEVVTELSPDVVHIRYDIAHDWSGDLAIFFRVLLSDEAGNSRLQDVTTKLVRRLEERLDFPEMGLFAYYNFRSVSEQAVLQEKSWA
ncbi:MAG: hypothetical protein LAQ69_31740 [Acidobacteriia bacterium]|nr:hypothetical protein [Terriglobia bacterium]